MKSAAPDILKPANYEQALAEIRRRVAQMEGGQVPPGPLPQSFRADAGPPRYFRSGLPAAEDEVDVLGGAQPVPWTVT